MAVVRVTKKFDNERAEQNENGLLLELAYQVEVNNKTDDASVAITANDGTHAIPEYASDHPTEADLKVTNIRAERSADGELFFMVYVTYSIPTNELKPPPTTDPRNWDLKIDIDGVEYTEAVQYGFVDPDGGGSGDAELALVRNTAGDPFPDGVKHNYYDELVTVSFKTDSVDTEELGFYRGYLNSDTVTMTIHGVSRSFAPHTLRMGNIKISAEINTADGETEFSVTIPMLYKVGTHIVKIANKGYNELIDWSESETPELDTWRVRDRFGQLKTSPSYLRSGEDDEIAGGDVGETAEVADGENVQLLKYWFDLGTSFVTLLSSIGA